MTARKKARRPEHVGGPRRPKAAAPSFARVRRVKQGATTWEASGRPAVSSANSSFRVRRHRSPMLYGPDGELKCGEDDWDQLRFLFRQKRIKEEQCDHCDASALRHIEETTTLNVWCLQKTIASQFRDGRSLQQLIDLLEAGSDLPMRELFSILRGILVCVRSPTGSWVRQFYTFDHRRLWCMHMAGCPKLRVEVELAGPLVDEMFRKTNGIGCKRPNAAVYYNKQVRGCQRAKTSSMSLCPHHRGRPEKNSSNLGYTGLGNGSYTLGKTGSANGQ